MDLILQTTALQILWQQQWPKQFWSHLLGLHSVLHSRMSTVIHHHTDVSACKFVLRSRSLCSPSTSPLPAKTVVSAQQRGWQIGVWGVNMGTVLDTSARWWQEFWYFIRKLCVISLQDWSVLKSLWVENVDTRKKKKIAEKIKTVFPSPTIRNPEKYYIYFAFNELHEPAVCLCEREGLWYPEER